MAVNLTKEEKTCFREAFSLFDHEGVGAIETSNLGTLVRALGQNPTQAELEVVIEQLDVDRMLNVIQFFEAMSLLIRQPIKLGSIVNGFKVFDREGKGLIKAAEFKHVMTTLGEKLTPEEADIMLEEATVNDDGWIDYRNFFAKLMSK